MKDFEELSDDIKFLLNASGELNDHMEILRQRVESLERAVKISQKSVCIIVPRLYEEWFGVELPTYEEY